MSTSDAVLFGHELTDKQFKQQKDEGSQAQIHNQTNERQCNLEVIFLCFLTLA